MAIYKEYTRRRPTDCCEPESRFYLQPVKDPKSDIWFNRVPLGKNLIGNIAKNMATAANLQSKKTNHSGRKTTIQTLIHANIPPTNVVQLTGHKNIQSLNSYSNMSTDQQHDISRILSNKFPVLPSHSQTTETNKENETVLNDLDDIMIEEFLRDDIKIEEFLQHDFSVEIEPAPSSVSTRNAPLTFQKPSNSSSTAFNFGTINGNVIIHVNQENDRSPKSKKRCFEE